LDPEDPDLDPDPDPEDPGMSGKHAMSGYRKAVSDPDSDSDPTVNAGTVSNAV
jgi:hypothetical protein